MSTSFDQTDILTKSIVVNHPVAAKAKESGKEQETFTCNA